MDYLVSQQVLPPPPLPPSSLSPVNERTEVSVQWERTSTKANSQEGTDLPLLFLSRISWEKKNCGWSHTGQIPRNSTSDITCSHPLLMEGEDLERAGAGEIKGGGCSGN